MAEFDNASDAQRDADVFSRMCASREVFQHVTGRWGALVVVALARSGDAIRFGELRRQVDGISDRMLSQTLGQLEREGVVGRTVRSSIPPHVDYALSPLGRRIADPLSELVTIVQDELPRVLEAQNDYSGSDRSRE